MSFEGMDVDDLRQLARQVSSDAETLYGIVSGLTDAFGGLVLFWHGPVAGAFEQDWQHKNRPALLAAYNTLNNLHTHLVNNINQQVTASAADSGSLLGGIATTWDALTAGQARLTVPEYLLDKEREIFGHPDEAPSGRPWTWMEKYTDDRVFPLIEDSKAIRWLHDTPALRTADELLVKTHGYKVLGKFFEPASIVLGTAAVGVDLTQAGRAAASGDYYDADLRLLDAEGDAAGMVPVVGQLLDFDIEMAKTDVVQIISGGPIPSPFSWQNLREDYLPLPGEMWQELGQDKGELLGLALGGHGPDE